MFECKTDQQNTSDMTFVAAHQHFSHCDITTGMRDCSVARHS